VKVAIPTENGQLCSHFGHCQVFTIIDVDTVKKEIINIQNLNPPQHERGVLPAWLHQLGCTHIIAGGMGFRALALFEQNGVQVISGATAMKPEEAVQAMLDGRLTTGGNPCHDPDFHRHGEGHGQCHAHDD